jgi:hypothetical protein
MSLTLAYQNQQSPRRPPKDQEFILEARLNLLALEYGYRYRLDVRSRNGSERVEFVRTLREARFIGIPVRRSGGSVGFSKINGDGTLKHHCW